MTTLALTSFQGAGNIGGIFLHGNRAYAGAIAVDISNPLQPVELFSWYGPYGFAGFSGAYAYYGDENGFRALNIDSPANPRVLTKLEGATNSFVMVEKANAFLLNQTNGLKVVDIRNTAAPQLISESPQIRGNRMKMQGRYGYIVGPNFQIVDFQNVTAPVVLTNIPGSFTNVAVQDSFAYVTDAASLKIYAITNKTTPILVGSSPVRGNVIVDGNYAYVAGESALTVVDIRDTSQPTVVGIGVGESYGYEAFMVKRGDIIYSTGYLGFHTTDVSNPRAPWTMGSYGPPFWGVDISVQGDHAYVIDIQDNLNVFDVSNPVKLRRVGGNCSLRARGVSVSADSLYIVSPEKGLSILDLFHPLNEPGISMLSPTVEGAVRLRVRGPANSSVIIQRAERLEQWSPWESVLLDDLPKEISDSNAAATGFYRVELR
jgi:hypothetical protein